MFVHRVAGVTREDSHQHSTVAEARQCEDESHQALDEIWAENAWLRAAELGTPDTWREEDAERMAEASGVPIPPGFL